MRVVVRPEIMAVGVLRLLSGFEGLHVDRYQQPTDFKWKEPESATLPKPFHQSRTQNTLFLL